MTAVALVDVLDAVKQAGCGSRHAAVRELVDGVTDDAGQVCGAKLCALSVRLCELAEDHEEFRPLATRAARLVLESRAGRSAPRTPKPWTEAHSQVARVWRGSGPAKKAEFLKVAGVSRQTVATCWLKFGDVPKREVRERIAHVVAPDLWNQAHASALSAPA